MGWLDGRRALVTGAGRNIGRATALALAGEGADVAVNARANQQELERVADEVRALGSRAVPVVADLSDPADVEAMIAQVRAEFGELDVLVANAAIRPRRPLHEVTYDDLRYVMAVNFESTVRLIQAFAPGMQERGWGRIITVVGHNSATGQANRSHVSAAKMATLGLTRSLSKELAPDGVLVNCVSPGHIETVLEDGTVKELPDDRVRDIPVGRSGRPEEVAALCRFLASDEASFINGQVISVNGGEGYV